MSDGKRDLQELPFNLKQICKLADTWPTPFFIYDEETIRENARALIRAFSWCPTFKEFFAVKATPNPHLLQILQEEGFGADASSMMELQLCKAVKIVGDDVMFTSNNTPACEFHAAFDLGAILNLDDANHLNFVANRVGLPEQLSFRFNPGAGRFGNAIIGAPENAKFGLTKKQLFAAYASAKEMGIKRLGLHAMLASNELDVEFFGETARMLFELALEVLDQTAVRIEFVNLGGGIGIPYHPDETPVNLGELSKLIRQHYDSIIRPGGLDPLTICMENGRSLTGPAGYLVTRAVHAKQTYKHYLGVDACMANLMRPGMYGAYHHISVLGKQSQPTDHRYDVVGSLCENNDKFAIDRLLPRIDVGDILVIHDAGAHGHSMGFQYNGKLRCAELLLQSDGTIREIRRAETAADYFATLDWPGLNE